MTQRARVPVVVWDDECEAVLADNKASARLSEFLGADCRLVYAPNSFERPVDPTRAPPDSRVGFADGFPLLVIGQASLDDLNARLNAKGRSRRANEPVPPKPRDRRQRAIRRG